jgi:hypothetical protein
VAAQMAASQEGLSSMELVIYRSGSNQELTWGGMGRYNLYRQWVEEQEP